MNLSIAELKEAIEQLPIPVLEELMRQIQKKIASEKFMQLAERGFTEWYDPEENIY
ncbi:MAG: hypothetical protein MUE44_00975 [Oscillatoriaceae cyanobacterium Prado104]|jgi:hypothetical protein|nr:hypothetical protein [Oscillatoriaceae cyanobacterium Prado104]